MNDTIKRLESELELHMSLVKRLFGVIDCVLERVPEGDFKDENRAELDSTLADYNKYLDARKEKFG